MSRFLKWALALAALWVVLTDSEPPAKPKKVKAEARVTITEEIRRHGDAETVAAFPPPESPRPPALLPDDGHSRVVSTWVTDQPESALDADVQVRRIPSDHDVEAVFVIDTTGSMGWIFDTARDKALELVTALEASRDAGKQVRAALVSYKDRRRGSMFDGRAGWGPEARHLETTPLSRDWAGLRAAFHGLRAQGGGDLPEDVQGGLLRALDGLDWTSGPDTTKLVYLIGDAPAQRYEDQPGLPALASRLATEGFTVHAFNASSPHFPHHTGVESDWRALSEATGGSYEVIRRPGGAPTGAEALGKLLKRASAALDGAEAKVGPRGCRLRLPGLSLDVGEM